MDLNIKKKLPEFRMIIDNQEYFKISLSLIFYSIYYSSLSDSFKIAEYFSLFINTIFNIDTSMLLDNLYEIQKTNVITKMSDFSSTEKNGVQSNIIEKIESAIEEIKIQSTFDKNFDLRIYNDKELDYSEVLELLKNKNTEIFDIDKFYNIDRLAKLISFKKGKEKYTKINIGKILFNSLKKNYFLYELIEINLISLLFKIDIQSSFSNKLTSEFESVLSLTPSLESQESGKTYKDIIILDESSKEDSPNKNHMFLPPKNKSNILFYANENYYVLIRYIFCIYERLNKLGDSSVGLDFYYQTSENIDERHSDMSLLKNFVTIYKAFVHKKIENSNAYEEYCRDILGNESYFLLNIDKLINSVSKFILIKNI